MHLDTFQVSYESVFSRIGASSQPTYKDKPPICSIMASKMSRIHKGIISDYVSVCVYVGIMYVAYVCMCISTHTGCV
jgi:hypothetical protein